MLKEDLFKTAILGFGLTEAVGLFAVIIAFFILFIRVKTKKLLEI